MAKIPSIFRKKYTEKSLNKRLLAKIYIQEDSKFIKSLFKKTKINNKDFYTIDETKSFSKNEQKRLKLIAKQIKKQKGRIKFLPLVAFLSIIFVISFLFIATKNFALKKFAKSYLEYTFEAKCEISKVDLKILDSSLLIKNFSIADKMNPMKNLFAFDELKLDFNLAQLMRKKFIAEDLSIQEFSFNSERTSDGSLSQSKLERILRRKNKKLLKQLEQQSENENTIYAAIQGNSSIQKIQSSFLNSFNSINPQSLLEQNINSLKTLETSKNIQDQISALNSKWKDYSDEINQKITALKKSTDSVLNFDYAAIQNNPAKTATALQNISKLIEDLNKVKTETTPLFSEIADDYATVTNLSKQLHNSIAQDKKKMQNQLAEIKSFSLSSNNLFSSTIESVGYSLLGKYYPYIKKGIDYLVNMKSGKTDVKKEETSSKKKSYQRLQGTNIEFKNDIYPSFWIKSISASGYGAKIVATDISSDMTKINKPLNIQANLNSNEIKHSGKITIDARKDSKEPLCQAHYNGNNIPVSYNSEQQGIPSISSNADFTFDMELTDNKTIVAIGKGNLENLSLWTISFEPKYASDIYSDILAKIKKATISLKLGFSEQKGINMKITSNIDNQIANALTSKINGELASIKKSIEKEITAKLTESTSPLTQQINSFNASYKSILNSSNSLNDIEKLIKEKQKEMTSKSNSSNEIQDTLLNNTNSLLNNLKQVIK